MGSRWGIGGVTLLFGSPAGPKWGELEPLGREGAHGVFEEVHHLRHHTVERSCLGRHAESIADADRVVTRAQAWGEPGPPRGQLSQHGATFPAQFLNCLAR
jgi:hypothetical protein